LVRAALPAWAATDFARLPEVQWVEVHQPPRMLNDVARGEGRLNVDIVHDTHGLDGTGQVVAIADTGLDSGDTPTLHPDFAGRLIQVLDIGRLTNWSDTYYHGTHVAGSVVGTGAASGGQYHGMAPGAGLVFQSIMTADDTLALPDDLNELYRPPHDLGARIHSDSWGSAVEGDYTSDSMTTDEFIWDHPDMLIAFAAGNDGTDENRDGRVDPLSLDAPASAKNVLAVGAAESGRMPGSGGRTSKTYGQLWYADYRADPIRSDYVSSSPAGAPQGMAAYSSHGPAADGRIKPDIVTPGTDIISARSRASADTGWGVLADNTNYCFMGGTSMATPLAAGAAVLVRQYATDVLGLEAPSAALLKAALAGGARALSPGQYGTDAFQEIPDAPRPNTVEGWGQIDVGATLYPTGGLSAVFLEGPTALHTGESATFDFVVTRNAPLTAIMAYSDYPSALAAAVNLVNNLDVQLEAPGGAVHHPHGLAEPDVLNNLEGVDVLAPARGIWRLTVTATHVPQGPQPYALYLRGALAMPATIEHTPLVTTWVTDSPYPVVADVTSAGDVDPASVYLHWNTTGDTNAITTDIMTSTNGHRFAAAIPPQPLGTRVYYALSAGPTNLVTHHPAEFPAEWHTFDITPALTLAVSGLPGQQFSVEPAYGLHTLASNVEVQARATFPVEGTNGWRTACAGWQGAGSVPAAGTNTLFAFTLTGPSIITWLWQEQAALTHQSTPAGALSGTTWHQLQSVAASLVAPEHHQSGTVQLTFAGWEVDGARWPTHGGPSRHQIYGIPMSVPRTATAIYLPTSRDVDANGLPDWFEERYFGGIGQDRYGDPDGDGHENELEAADHTDPLDPASFPEPPVIQHDPLPSPATLPAPWGLSATITDNHHVAAATLHWQRNGGLVRSVAMSNTVGDLFTAAIPSPARDGDVIAYSLSAVDDAGYSTASATWTVTVAYARIALSPESLTASLPGQSQTNLLLNIQNAGSRDLEVELEIAPIGLMDDMESGAPGWTRPDGNLDWHLSSQESASPTHAWYCGQEITRIYRNSTHAGLVSPPIQLAADSPRLDFQHRALFEIDQDEYPDGVHYWDSGVLEISANSGLTWNALMPEGGYPGLITSNPASPFAPGTPCFVDTDGWEPVGADLSAYTGQNVQLRFRFGADAYVVNEGWRIDDVIVSPRTEYEGWLDYSITNWTIGVGFGVAVPIHLDTTPLPPMASGHLALLVHHNDPEVPSPIVVPVALFNTTRRVRVMTDGPGHATPTGEFLLAADTPFAVDFAADGGAFIADIQTNAALVPLPGIITTQTLSWTSLASNLDVQAVFAPWLAEGLVPPAWLAQFGLTNRHWMAEASLDQDRDGFLTWQEHDLGTNPTNPADARLVVNFQTRHPGTNAWRIVWHAFTNRQDRYDVLATTHLTDGFVVVTNLPATPPVMTSPPLPADHFFFGIRKP
ncbi:MAG: S8 family serine peptidase, partial [Kiritimatiellia bacterium]|nr:S8 family serine peptidase [Kiritimatiellia bacterium]